MKVGNHGACVKDSDAGFGWAVGTARMTKSNIDFEHGTFRTINPMRLHSGLGYRSPVATKPTCKPS